MDDEGSAEPVDMLRGGTSRTLDAFYVDEYARVLRVVYPLCGSWPVAEEICQDAFIRVVRNWDEVALMDHPEGWVRRVACNLATSRLRRLAAEARALARHAARRSEPMPQPLGDDTERFWQLLRSLPRRQAQVVVLHYAEDRSVVDVAEILELSEGAVKAHLHSARGRLRERLDRTEEGAS